MPFACVALIGGQRQFLASLGARNVIEDGIVNVMSLRW